MPVNFQFPLDASVVGNDFEVLGNLGNMHTLSVLCWPLPMKMEESNGASAGEFGTAVTNPLEVRVVTFTTETFSGESACSDIINLNGMTTTNVIPLADGPSLFFAQKIEDGLNECSSGTQTIQVAWDGGVTPYISGDEESDLFQYYTGYLTVLEFWYRMHRFPSQISMTTTIFTNCVFLPQKKSSKSQ